MWQRMVHVIQASVRRDLLPFPILITRILQANGVDVRCEKYDVGLGSIDAVTWAKSVSTLKTFQQAKGPPPQAASSTAPPPPPRPRPETAGSSSSGGVPSIESLHHDVRILKKKVGDLGRKLELGLKRILEKLGCRHDDIFPPERSYTTYRRSTSRHPFLSSTDAPEEGDSRAEAGDNDDEDTE